MKGSKKDETCRDDLEQSEGIMSFISLPAEAISVKPGKRRRCFACAAARILTQIDAYSDFDVLYQPVLCRPTESWLWKRKIEFCFFNLSSKLLKPKIVHTGINNVLNLAH